MKAVAVGPILDAEGVCHYTRATATPGGPAGFTVDVRHHFIDGRVELRATQRADLPVSYRHQGRPVGTIQHLERDGRGSVWALAEIDPLAVPMTALFWSAELGGDDQLTGAALTPDPAEIGLLPVRMFAGTLTDQDERRRLMLRNDDPFVSALLGRAVEASRRRRYGDSLTVWDGRHHDVERMAGGYLVDGGLVGGEQRVGPIVTDDGRTVGPLEVRPCGPILSVRSLAARLKVVPRTRGRCPAVR